MTKRKGSDIIRAIIQILKQNPGGLALRALESKVDTNTSTIKDYCTLLAELSLIELIQEEKGSKTITKAKIK